MCIIVIYRDLNTKGAKTGTKMQSFQIMSLEPPRHKYCRPSAEIVIEIRKTTCLSRVWRPSAEESPRQR